MFQNFIGQDHIKRSLSFYCQAYERNLRFPTLLFTGARGIGKTEIARTIAEEMKIKFIELNAETVVNIDAFLNQIFAPHAMGQQTLIFIDEAHGLPDSVQNAFLSIFNVEANQTQKTFNFEGSDYIFDFTQQVFIFATTEQDKIFPPLKDRMKEIDFRPYTLKELSAILIQKCSQVQFENGLTEVIAECLRGNARDAVKLSIDISTYAQTFDIGVFTLTDWLELCQTLGIQPNGLNNSEIQILQLLRDRGPMTLTNLAASTGLSRTAIQHSVEAFLMRRGYIIIDGKRELTPKGVAALSDCVV